MSPACVPLMWPAWLSSLRPSTPPLHPPHIPALSNPLMASVRPFPSPRPVQLLMTIHKTLFGSGGEEGPCEGGGLTKRTVCGMLPQTLKDLRFTFPSKLQAANNCFEWYMGLQKSHWQGHYTRSFLTVARRGHHSNGHHNIHTGQGMPGPGNVCCVSGLELPSRDTWHDFLLMTLER